MSLQKILFIGVSVILIMSGCTGNSGDQPVDSNNDQSSNYTVLPEGEPIVTVGIWKTDDCSGDPVMILTFPVNYAAQQCYAWAGSSGENSATNFSCGNNSITYTQWTSLTCNGGQRPDGTDKIVYTTQCQQDVPPTIYTQILDFSGCIAK